MDFAHARMVYGWVFVRERERGGGGREKDSGEEGGGTG